MVHDSSSTRNSVPSSVHGERVEQLRRCPQNPDTHRGASGGFPLQGPRGDGRVVRQHAARGLWKTAARPGCTRGAARGVMARMESNAPLSDSGGSRAGARRRPGADSWIAARIASMTVGCSMTETTIIRAGQQWHWNASRPKTRLSRSAQARRLGRSSGLLRFRSLTARSRDRPGIASSRHRERALHAPEYRVKFECGSGINATSRVKKASGESTTNARPSLQARLSVILMRPSLRSSSRSSAMTGRAA